MIPCADPSCRHPKRAHAPIAYFPLYAAGCYVGKCPCRGWFTVREMTARQDDPE